MNNKATEPIKQINEQNDRQLCACCCLKEGNKRCGGCKQTYYCSKECQTKHWAVHKRKCKKIKRKKKKINKATKQNNVYQSMAKNMFNTGKLSMYDEISANKPTQIANTALSKVKCVHFASNKSKYV